MFKYLQQATVLLSLAQAVLNTVSIDVRLLTVGHTSMAANHVFLCWVDTCIVRSGANAGNRTSCRLKVKKMSQHIPVSSALQPIWRLSKVQTPALLSLTIKVFRLAV